MDLLNVEGIIEQLSRNVGEKIPIDSTQDFRRVKTSSVQHRKPKIYHNYKILFYCYNRHCTRDAAIVSKRVPQFPVPLKLTITRFRLYRHVKRVLSVLNTLRFKYLH